MKNSINFCLRLFLFALLSFVSACGNDLNDSPKDVVPVAVITQDSELFKLITRVTDDTTDPANPLDGIVCIDFVYPLSLNIYDGALNIIGNQVIMGDDHFSNFLGALPAGQSLSISYPISTMLGDGSTFSVHNNSELKLAIDSCSREDIINYCTALFCNVHNGVILDCFWKVQYAEGADNKYVGGTFLTDPDGSLVFNYNGIDYNGTWSFLFVNDEFHININLEGTSAVALDWNIDRVTEVNGGDLIIHNTKDIVLNQVCESQNFTVGSEGPAGGVVFYDKGFYSEGWRYIEAATADLGNFEWGCATSSVLNAQHAGIGKGLINTAAVVNFHDSLSNYYTNPSVCNGTNNGTVAAKIAIKNNSGGYSDWFLPSVDELNLMYTALHLQSLGGFSAAPYWTSTQVDASHANTIDFTTGVAASSTKIAPGNTVRARAIRYF